MTPLIINFLHITPLFIKEGSGEISEIPLNPPFEKGENERG